MTALPRTLAGRIKIALLQLIVAYIVVARLWFDIAVTPMGDEAYYWMWGQHLSWSYFDHPPLDGWLQGLVATVLPWSNFSVRVLTWATLAGTLYVLWQWSKRLGTADPQSWFWHTAAIYLTIPTICVVGGVGFHDHLLIAFALASIFTFHRFAESWEDGAVRWHWLYASAVFLGLAVLSKYNGVFLGLGFALWVLVRPRLRSLLLTPQLWLAVLIAIAIQAPVFYWNLTEGFASFRFHLGERPTAHWSNPDWRQMQNFILAMPLAMSPVLFLAALRLIWLRGRSDAETRALGLARVTYFSSTIAWAVLAAFVTVYFHWNILAYVALAPVLYRLVGGRIALFLHIAFGLFVTTFGLLSYTITPLRIGNFSDPGAAANYGWRDVADRAAAQQSAHPGSFLGATRYTYAAQLGFQLHNINVAAFNPVRSQNDYWWDATAHAGEDAIIVADGVFPIAAAEKSFASVEKLETVEARDDSGKAVWLFEIWLARDFRPAAP